MIDVSVIVPVYNSEKYLRECIDSIIGQTAAKKLDMEVIFVDDGSTDNSLDILNEYSEKYQCISVLQNNHSGGGAARNVGIENAHGEYIMFFDSDDYMEPEMIEKAYNQCKKEDADITVFSVRFWHEATGAVTDEVCGLRTENLPGKEVFSWKDMPNYIFNTFHNWPWNKIFKRSFIEDNHIRFQEIMRTNDLLFTCKALMLAEQITYVNEYLVKYRVRVTDSCQASNSKAPLDFYKAFLALKEFLEEKGFYPEVKQSFVNHALDGCIANLNTADFNSSHKIIFNALKDDIFKKLDILGNDDEYFYPQNVESKNVERFHHVVNDDYENFLLYRANELNDLFHERLYLGYHDWQRILGFERQVEENSRYIEYAKNKIKEDENDLDKCRKELDVTRKKLMNTQKKLSVYEKKLEKINNILPIKFARKIKEFMNDFNF